jgi:tetratricopeptide (TPR) repeat protein
MKNLRQGSFIFLCLFCVQLLSAQQTAIFTEANLAYNRGVDFFNQKLYGLAQKEFQQAINLTRPVNEPEWRALKLDAELYNAKAAVRLGQPEAEKLVLDFLRENSPSPVASQAALEIGNYYFESKQYDKALTYYDMAPTGGLGGTTRDEIRFKQGYSYFVTKKFGQARAAFAPLRDNARSEWYHAANYYSGFIAFYENKFDEAAKAFSRAEQSNAYKASVPYLITQIYFAKKQYDQVIAYGAPKAQDPSVKNRAELNQIVGQAYFEQGDYKRALPYLEYAVNNGARVRPADYYQLGYAQYQAGAYKAAIENFEQLTKQDSALGQNGLYHLGDAYLRTGNKFAARNAFGQASQMNFDKSVREDALFNYAKLSYELKFDRDAIEALQRLPSNSKYYDDAQALMSEVFLNTRDYDRAIATLEGLKNRTRRLDETYQKVTYYRGLQLYQTNMKDEARRYFNKSLDFPLDKRIATLCGFWLGSIANEKGEYDISRQHMTAFLNAARNYRDLPEESSLYMGQYVQGYNYLKAQDYANALTNFKAAVQGIKANQGAIQSAQIKTTVLGDAVLRAGDGHFKRREYSDAVSYYNEAVNRKYDGFEYALYQKAVIRGLQGNTLDKVVALEDLVNKYPGSRYTDEALFQLGDAYEDLGRLEQAIPPLKQLVQNYRGKSGLVNQALLKLGLISYNQGNNQAAINYYKQVFANNPENAEARDALAALEEIYVKDMNRPDEYLAFLETVPGYKVSNASKDSVTYFSAENQYNNGRYDQAIEGFTNYIAKYPNGRNILPAYYYRAESYMVGANPKSAQALKDYAYVVGRGQSRFYNKAVEKAALLAANTGEFGQALEFGRKWEESAANDAARLDAQLVVLRAAYRQNVAATVNEYATKVTNAPGASDAQIAMAQFYLGRTLYDKSDFARAYTAFQQVTQRAQATPSEQSAEAYHLMAQILYSQRKFQQAEDLIGEANKNSAGYDDWIARNLILLSDVYADQGDKNSARAALEAVLENYKGNNQQIISDARAKYAKLGGNAPAVQRATQTPRSPGNLLEVDDRN